MSEPPTMRTTPPMPPMLTRLLAATAAALLLVPATRAEAQSSAARARSDSLAIAKARADSVRLPYTAADVAFLSGMIGHHAQAITMSRLAASHGASDAVQTLAGRIINAQQDEIAIMQQWLRDRRQPVPDPLGTPDHAAMDHAAMDHAMGHAMDHAMMPGMLTPAQMAQLDSARGDAFDRLFLRDMIQHHEGAIAMVRTLFATPGAGQDEMVFKLASDANVDQATEIARMQRMLAAILFGTP